MRAALLAFGTSTSGSALDLANYIGASLNGIVPLAVTTDGAANIRKAARAVGAPVRCLAHAIQIAVRAGLADPAVSNAVTELQAQAAAVRRSAPASE